MPDGTNHAVNRAELLMRVLNQLSEKLGQDKTTEEFELVARARALAIVVEEDRAATAEDRRETLPHSRAVENVLNEHAHRVWEATAILEFVGELLSDGAIDLDEQARCMSAVKAAIRILKPVPSPLACKATMAQEVERYEAEQEELEAEQASA